MKQAGGRENDRANEAQSSKMGGAHKPIISTRKDENQLSSIIRQANSTIIKQNRRNVNFGRYYKFRENVGTTLFS